MKDKLKPIYLPIDTDEVSDGYHTFKELYDHRNLLWVMVLLQNRNVSFKTHKDDSGHEIENWFIAGINTDYGQLTYHLPNDLWDILDVPEVDYNFDYDGHDSKEVLNRLFSLAKSVNGTLN